VSQQILFGRRKNKAFAGLIAVESLCTLGLALYLVPRHGIVGMAIAAAIPMVVGEGLLVPYLATRQAGSGLIEYYRQALLPNVLVTGGLYLAGRLLLPYAPHGGWGPVFLCFTLVSLAYLAAAWFFLVHPEHRADAGIALRALWSKAAGRPAAAKSGD
jgi:O-antigen/teichoic acid export membrane protein